MRTVSDLTTERWKNPTKVGPGRAWARVTIQPLILQKFSGPEYEKGGCENVYTSMVFGNIHPEVRELTNIKTISITRGTTSDAQTCTIEIFNTENIQLGEVVSTNENMQQERPGWFSFQRGDTAEWGHPRNAWYGWIVPDRIIRTYSGYGIDGTVAPDKDTNMYPSGVWLIDTVTLTPEGTISIECRDLARELLEQLMFIPVIPKDYYPLRWEHTKSPEMRYDYTLQTWVPVPPTTVVVWVPQGLETLSYVKDSNLPYIGKGLVDGDKPYVWSDGTARHEGHGGHSAFDGSNSSYWLSVGNKAASSDSSFVFVEGLTQGSVTVAGVQIKAWGGPYVVYISVKRGGKWSGVKYIPYSPSGVDTGAKIHYVRTGKIGRNATKTFRIPVKYTEGVQAIRVTLHDLYDSNIGTYPYRGGLYDVRWTPEVIAVDDLAVDLNGFTRYTLYTDIVKTLLAWGGFFWPRASTGRSYLRSTDGTMTTIAQTGGDDPVLAQGQVWGDIEVAGVGGDDNTKLDAEMWDKKPIIDGIKYVRDILAYVFFIDETGGAIFRTPNIWKLGNWMSGADGGPHEPHTTDVIVLNDEEDLLSHSLRISSLNRRDRVFVANMTGSLASGSEKPMGAVAKGYDPFPSGTRRISGWTDQHFSSQKEVDTMAALIAVRQALKMRSASVEIPGYPAIQIDDQVIVKEQITGTDHLFYVDGIQDSYDAVSGRWTYQLTLQWLGSPTHLMTVTDIELGDNAMSYINEMLARQ
jgi:hypothetical protein